ncbi:hypothetical protein LAZ67_11001888 [Cordylochernes scorpioides]|uniref:Mos1 transposase HTH domain-containing protein n=1 Tax=Cordylochernes scorpioides TaxID=51811 RepID=A0ABY6KZH4_9ARAC|nr:hypothetical protein LAZ67_11001888 [Cordylochernes scorpioides]
MVPSKLLRHIETNHREQMNNPISYFENIRSSFQKQSKKFKKFMTTSDEAQTASYMIAQLIARKKKAHAEAEEIILPALKIVAGCMLTNDAMEKVTKIPLSSKTIARRIEDMSEDIELQIKQSFNDSSTKWAIQLDETTDISNKAQLLAFLRFVDTGKIVNNYFFCKELKQRTTDLNNLLNPYPNIIESRRLAIQRTNDRHDKEKLKYDNKHKNPHFDTGDLVLVKAYHHPNSETLALMNEAYEDEILSRTQVYFWYKRFKDGRKSLADDSRSGRPLTSTTDRNIGQTIRRQSRSSRRKKMDAKVLGTKFQDFDGILGRSTSNPRYINPRRNAFEVDKSSISKYALVSVVQAKILMNPQGSTFWSLRLSLHQANEIQKP